MRALITGGSSGIGRGIAKAMQTFGHEVYVTSRNVETIDNKLKDVGYLTLDLTSPPSIERISEKLHEIDILVNNAGVSCISKTETNSKYIQDVFSINFFGQVTLTERIIERRADERLTRVVNIGSFSNFFPLKHYALYSASKAAFTNYTKSLRHEFKSKNVDVCMIHPLEVNTNIVTLMDSDDEDITETFLGAKLRRMMGDSADSMGIKIAKIINKKKYKPEYVIGRFSTATHFATRIFSQTMIEKIINLIDRR